MDGSLTSGFDVVVSAGTLAAPEGVRLPHQWTDGGVVVETDFTGAHLLHLAVAGCVLNDVFREAGQSGVAVRGVRVRASGGFDTDEWASTGVDYAVEVDSPDDASAVEDLLRVVDAVAEIPRALRQGGPVRRSALPRGPAGLDDTV